MDDRYLEETGPEHEPISPTKKRGAGVAGIKLPPSAARASASAGSKAGPLSPRNFTGTRPETLQDKVCFAAPPHAMRTKYLTKCSSTT